MTNLAFVFPGQGSQSVGMLAELAEVNPLIETIFTRVSSKLGYDVWRLVQAGPEEILNQTEHTQVAMLTADVAIFKAIEQYGMQRPLVMAGHSLGEYAALVCADALSLEDAAVLVKKRGQLMQERVPLGKGAMAAIIGLDAQDIELICSKLSTSEQQVTPANYNAIGQVVIAGHSDAVNQAITCAEEMGARMAKLIPVSVPCHCPLLTEAAEAFAEDLANIPFKIPKVAVVANVDLSIYQTIPQMRTLLEKQLYHPVRWVETIQFIKNYPVETIIECGPGKVLSGLIKRIDKSLAVFSVNDPASLQQVVPHLSNL